MKYDDAKKLAEAKGLIVGPESDVLPMDHLNVCKVEGGPHFSISLPQFITSMPMTNAEQEAHINRALDAAIRALPPPA